MAADCDRAFTPGRYAQRQRYCSPTCRKRMARWRMFADPERRARALAYNRDLYARSPERRQRAQDRVHWNLTSVQYAQKLLANRRRRALQRLSERAARSEERRKEVTRG